MIQEIKKIDSVEGIKQRDEAREYIMEKVEKEEMVVEGMKQINEIMVEEYDGNVKDYSVVLNTAQSMQAEVTTKKINGCLKALIISADNPVQINISIARLPIFPFVGTAFVIYENVDFKGEDYIPIRCSAINKLGEKFNFSQEEWMLNDKIRVFVKGSRNTNVNVTFRYI